MFFKGSKSDVAISDLILWVNELWPIGIQDQLSSKAINLTLLDEETHQEDTEELLDWSVIYR